MTTLVWFRQDLRLGDNPALDAAIAGGGPILPLYIHAPQEAGVWAPGGASQWWLHHSLASLDASLRMLGSRLCLRGADDSLATLLEIARTAHAGRVVWNRLYEPWARARDTKIKTALQAAGLQVESFNAALLHEPWTIKTKSGGPFQVFTPFWRHALSLEDPAVPAPAPTNLCTPARMPRTQRLSELQLLPTVDWAVGIRAHWKVGCEAAHAALEQFLNNGIDAYPDARDRPGIDGTSRLSPHLHFGEISPRQIWHATRDSAQQRGQQTTWRDSRFLTELGWREFAYHLLYHFPHTPEQPLRTNFARFPWKTDLTGLTAWMQGKTGYPIVDAGLRQLWQTGWMHNRVRMVVASFLIKDLLINWTEGERWFWDTLVDADLANNTLGWQWVAGCGADAAPFFRIFNPTSQGAKFDNDGTYVRRWLPELARLPDAWLHDPSGAPADVLTAAGIRLGTDYPYPIVDHNVARKEALAALGASRN